MKERRRHILEALYAEFNRPELISPDPLEVVIQYDDIRDREIIGLISASLAYGRVVQIIRSVRKAIEPLGQHPRDFIDSVTDAELRNTLPDFKHRFTTGAEIGALFVGIKRAIAEFGSLNDCFLEFHQPDSPNVLPALSQFVQKIACDFPESCSYLLSSPLGGSACKRMNLFLKWMVRRDDVDPGGWRGVSPSQLIVPLDSHMFNICSAIGMTKRKTPDIKAALEITTAFKAISFDDPTKYDFAITRLGIRSELAPNEFIKRMTGIE
ncbi:MAG TPA: TIGR02757 family protein [candidate division Zixibacteria bacterium]|nr:TIGR02757 family protein [candidate division Zixibacteria bacterium]